MKDLLDLASAASQEENIQLTRPATQDDNDMEGVAAQNDWQHIIGVDMGAHRRGNAGRKTKAFGAKRAEEESHLRFKGAPTWIDYSDRVYKAVKAAHQHRRDSQGVSISAAATRAGAELRESGIVISHRQLMRNLQEANLTGEFQPPEKPGGVFMPFELEKRIAWVIRELRKR
jgi:hypothetical protein